MGKPLELDRQQQPTAASQRLHAVAAPGGEQQQRQLQPDNSRLQANSASLRTAAAASGCINNSRLHSTSRPMQNSASCKQQQHNRLRASGTGCMREQRSARAAAEAQAAADRLHEAAGLLQEQRQLQAAASARGADSSSRLLHSSRQQAGTATGCSRQASCSSSRPHAGTTPAASGSGSDEVQTAATDYCSSSR